MSKTIDFGIDLGTTNSAIAKFTKGKVEILRNPADWKDTCPSVVGFRKERILVGSKAREYREKDPKNVVGQFKRKMGTTETFLIKTLNDSKTPVELSAFVLKELKTFIQSGEILSAAVITVPASFDIIQSNATKEAAKEAGFEHVVLLQEPIAASLAYANRGNPGDFSDGRWLVYDLGGGTFDVALVSISEGEMKIVDHEGDNFLGGSDFDRLIVEHIIIPYLSENYSELNLEEDFQSGSGRYNALFYGLLRRAEDAKILLSSRSSAEIEFEFEDEEVFINLTKSEFERLIKESVDRSAAMVKTILTRNSLSAHDIDFVLMVGGSTYIPYVRNRIGELLQVPVRNDIDPTTAVAAGAAFYAGTKEILEAGQDELVENQRSITIRAAYEKTSHEDEEFFAARASGNIEGLYYKIVRSDGGFDTGLRKLEERISEDLTLVKDSFNYFSFKVYDSKNNEIETNFKEIKIAHNMVSIYGQPLTADVCVELDDLENQRTYLKQIFAKNSILPLKQMMTQTVTRTVSKDSADDLLLINVYEGSSLNIPESNQRLATLRINSIDLDRNVVKGCDIELQFEISESRELTVSAYIPYTDQTFREVFIPEDREVEVWGLQSDIESLDERVTEEIVNARDRNDADLLQELTAFSKELNRLQDKAAKLIEDDETDVKFQLDDEKKKIAQKIDSAIQARTSQRLLENYYQTKERCQILIEETDNEMHQAHLKEITALERTYTTPPSPLQLKNKIGEIDNLYYSILWKQPAFLADVFNSITEDENDYKDTETAQRLIREGQIAIIDGNNDKLRESIFGLFDQMPKERRSNYPGKTGIG